jgi:hypothetical protein
MIINRATFTISYRFTAGESFYRGFNVGFKADEVIVRSASYGDVTNDRGTSVINTDLILNGSQNLCVVTANTLASAGPPQIVNTVLMNTSNPESHHIVAPNKINNGQATFNINKITGTGIISRNTNADGLLVLVLEFVEYKK